MAKKQDVAVVDEKALVIGADQFKMEEVMEGIDVYLPQIAIIHQGAMFEMPDGEMLKSFTGTIIDMHRTCAYWSQSFDDTGGGEFPECYSMNGIEPSSDLERALGQTCRKCCKNYNNVVKIDGKPSTVCCKSNKRLHVLVGDSMLPYRLIASVKNIKPIDVFVSMLAGQSLPYPLIETEFSLKKVTSQGGQEYSELVLKKVGPTPLVKSVEDAQKLKAMIAQWKGVMRNETVFEE